MNFTIQQPSDSEKEISSFLDELIKAVKKLDEASGEFIVEDCEGNAIDSCIDLALKYEVTEKKVVKLVKEAVNRCGDTWEDEDAEIPLGLWWAVKLVHHSEKHLKLFTDYILATDLNYHVHQRPEIEKVIEVYGWNKATYKLYAEVVLSSLYFGKDIFQLNNLLKKLAHNPREEKMFFKYIAESNSSDEDSVQRLRTEYDELVAEGLDQKYRFPDDFEQALENEDHDTVLEIMDIFAPKVQKMDLGYIFLLNNDVTIPFIKKLITLFGKEQLQNYTRQSYRILKRLYQNYEENREVIEYLWSEGVLSYTRDGALPPTNNHPIEALGYLLSIHQTPENLESAKAAVKELIERGVSLNELCQGKGKSRSTLIELLLQVESPSFELVDFVIEQGADLYITIDEYDKNGVLTKRKTVITAVLEAAELPTEESAWLHTYQKAKREQHPKFLALLQKLIGEGVEYTPQPGYDLIPAILKTGNREIIDYMNTLEVFDFTGKDAQGLSYNFAVEAQPELLIWMLDNGADINGINAQGRTLLINAVRAIDVEAAKLLHPYNPDDTIVDANRRTAFETAMKLYRERNRSYERDLTECEDLEGICELYGWDYQAYLATE